MALVLTQQKKKERILIIILAIVLLITFFNIWRAFFSRSEEEKTILFPKIKRETPISIDLNFSVFENDKWKALSPNYLKEIKAQPNIGKENPFSE